MTPHNPPITRNGCAQFSLGALLGYTTQCALLMAASGVIGLAPSVCLMGLALSLAAKQGLVALVCTIAASVSADGNLFSPGFDNTVVRQFAVLFIAAVQCMWYNNPRKYPAPSVAGRTLLQEWVDGQDNSDLNCRC